MLTYGIVGIVVNRLIDPQPMSNAYGIGMLVGQLIFFALLVKLPISKKGRNACVSAGETLAKVGMGITFAFNLFWFFTLGMEVWRNGFIGKHEATTDPISGVMMNITFSFIHTAANFLGDCLFWLGMFIVWMGLLCMRNKDKKSAQLPEDDIDSRRREGDALLAAERGQCRGAYGADAYADANANNKVNLV